jgi:hypothetical protein
MSDDRQVLDRIAAIQALVSGVTKAFADAPRDLKDGELPAFVNIYSEQTSTVQRADAGRLRKIARYEMNLYVKKASQGIEYEAQQIAVPLIKLVEDEFFARRMLQLDDDQGLGGVENAEITGVKFGSLAYNTTLYTGTTFFLEVVYTRMVPQR